MSPLYAEELSNLSYLGLSTASYYAAFDLLNPPYYRALNGAATSLQCRKTVATKLLEADNFLRPCGIALHVWDAQRSLKCQKALWDYFVEDARRKKPAASQDEWTENAKIYCSDPSQFNSDDPTTWPSHLTGGAVDLTLKRISTGELLFMGGVFDDPSEISHTAYFEAFAAKELLTPSNFEARRNRRLLYWVMNRFGFSNFSNEWWHYDWGTQMWVANFNHQPGVPCPAKAHYGPATIPDK